jgi:cysteinyl-tRNA synthetase
LRNFHYRLTKESFPAGESSALESRAQEARQKFEAGLDDNLNTAEALAAIFDLIRDGNTAMDRGEFHDGDRGPFLDTLHRWDRVFAVLDDDDHAKLVKFGFVKAATTVSDSAEDLSAEAVKQEMGNGHPRAGLVETLSDEEIEQLVAERAGARRRGDYARSDQIRANLLEAGVILEDTKAGARWKRK